MRIVIFRGDKGWKVVEGGLDAVPSKLPKDAMIVEIEVEPNAGMAAIIAVHGGLPR